MEALYDAGRSDLGRSKKSRLAPFQDDGFWLLDAADRPINKLSRPALDCAARRCTGRHRRNQRGVARDGSNRVRWTHLETADVKDGLLFCTMKKSVSLLGNWRQVLSTRYALRLRAATFAARPEAASGREDFPQSAVEQACRGLTAARPKRSASSRSPRRSRDAGPACAI
jgi:hypothetical protein